MNGGVTFTGSNYLQTSTSIDFPSLSNGVSFSFWFKFTGTPSQGWVRIFDFGNGQSQQNIQATRDGTSNNLYTNVLNLDATGNIVNSVQNAWPLGTYLDVCVCIYIHTCQYVDVCMCVMEPWLAFMSRCFVGVCIYFYIHLCFVGVCIYSYLYIHLCVYKCVICIVLVCAWEAMVSISMADVWSVHMHV